MLCDCSCVLPESLRAHDLTPTRLKGINLGHDPRRSKYLVYIPAVRRIISTADVIFDEFSFTTLGGAWQPFKTRGGPSNKNALKSPRRSSAPSLPPHQRRQGARPSPRPPRELRPLIPPSRGAQLGSPRAADQALLLACCSIDIQSTAPIVYYLEPGRRKVTCHVH